MREEEKENELAKIVIKIHAFQTGPIHVERNKHMIIKFRFLMLFKKNFDKFGANLAPKLKKK